MKIIGFIFLVLSFACPTILVAQKPELVTVKDGHIGPVKVGCFSPDGRQAITGGADRRVVLWDLHMQKYVRHFETADVPLHLAYTGNGLNAIVLTYDKLQLWNLESGELLSEYSIPDNDEQHGTKDTLWCTLNGKTVAAWIITNDKVLPLSNLILDLPADNASLIEKYPMLAARMSEFSFNENARILHIPSRQLAIIYGGETTGYWMVTPGTPMNRSGSGFIMVWDLMNDKPIDTLIKVSEQIINVVLNNSDTHCLALSEDKKVYHLDIASSSILQTFEKASTEEVRYTFTHDFSTMAMIDYRGNLRVWPMDYRSNIEDYSAILSTVDENGYYAVETACFSPDKKSIIVGDRMGTIVKLSTSKPIRFTKFQKDPHVNVVQDLVFAPDGTSLLVGSALESRIMMLYMDQLPKRDVIQYIKDGTGNVIGFVTNSGVQYGSLWKEDSEYVFWSPNHNTQSLWDAETGSIIRLFRPYQTGDWVNKQRQTFSPDGRFAFSMTDDRWHGWDIASGTILSEYPTGRRIDAFYFRENEGYALTKEEQGQIMKWQLGGEMQGDIISELKNILSIGCNNSGSSCWCLNHEGGIFEWNAWTDSINRRISINAIPDEPEILATPHANLVLVRGKGSATLINAESGITLVHLERDPNDVCEGDLYYDGHRASDVSTFTFIPGSNHALSATYDGTMKIWNIITGEEAATISFPGSMEWVVSTPDGLFDATEGAMRQMYFRIGTEVIELEQLKERYFEPGLLQKILGFTPGGMRPVSDLSNVALYPQILHAQLNEDVLKVTLKPREGGIGRVALMLNHNIELQANINPDYTSTFEINLTPFQSYFNSADANTLSIRAYNQEGWLKSPPFVIADHVSGAKGSIGGTTRSLTAEKDTRLASVHLYALIIGTSNYRGQQLNLKYPDKDAAAFAEALSITGKSLFGENISITTLTTEGTTWPRRQEIASAFSDIASQATSNDILLVYLSGHGITYPPNSEKGQFYYLTTDILNDKLDDPVTRMTQAIGQDTLQEWIRQVKALKRILILDACNSGKVVESLSVGEKSLNGDQRRALERMYDRSGMFVLAGSAGDKLSFEASQFGHGLLTYSLLNNIPLVAAKNSTYIDVGKLFNNALEEVPRLARDIGKYQQPELIGNSSFDIGILTPDAPYQVPQAVPVFIRPSFMNIAGNRDNIRLSSSLSQYLDEMAREPEAQMAYWDIDDYQGKYYYIGGSYKISGENIDCSVSVYERSDLITEFKLSGSVSNVRNLAQEIVQEVFTSIDQR